MHDLLTTLGNHLWQIDICKLVNEAIMKIKIY